jgi:hypothetical protein
MTVTLGRDCLLRAFGLPSPHRVRRSQSPAGLASLTKRRSRRAAEITWAKVAFSYPLRFDFSRLLLKIQPYSVKFRNRLSS